VFLTFAKRRRQVKKVCNELFLPASQDLRARLTVGERRFPATEDLQGFSIFYRRLMQAITVGTRSHTPAIDRKAYAGSSFICAFDTEAAPAVQHTGINTTAQSLNVFLEGICTAEGEKPTAVFLTAYSDTLLEVNKRGVIVGV